MRPDDTQKYDGTISFLYGLQKYGIKLGLENTVKLLSLLGNPQRSFRCVHIAGTNGKGSVSAMTASMLQAAGFTVGLFTSPHLVSFTERIRVNGSEIPEKDVVELTESVREVVSMHFTISPTFFEFVTAIAFLYFVMKKIDWAVIETGMGGRLDATNVITPQVSVITNIGMDHREFLGETLEEIAMEKAGIIKESVPVVSSPQVAEAMEVIAKRTVETGSPLFIYGRDFRPTLKQGDMSGITFDYKGERSLSDLFVPLCGEHQLQNASVALRTMECIRGIAPIEDSSLREGLRAVHWPGRLELIRMDSGSYDVLIDGAHNPAAALSLAHALQQYVKPVYDRVILILGIMADKDMDGIMKPLLPLATQTIFTAPDYSRAAPPVSLAEQAGSRGYTNVTVAATMKKALETAVRLSTEEASPGGGKAVIVITGSFYTIGEAKIVLGCRGILTRLRE